jgi:hypothetical protein
MNPGIILSGAQPNLLGNMAQGMQMRFANEDRQQEAQMRDLYAQHGAGLVNGDPGAINALAAADPAAAFGFKTGNAQEGRAAEMHSAQLAQIRENAKRTEIEYARQMNAEQAAATKERLSGALQGAAFFFSKGDQQGYEQFLAQQGIDPQQFPFQQFPAHAARVLGSLDALSEAQELQRGPEPLSSAGKFYRDQELGNVPQGETYKAGNSVTVNSGPNEGAFQKKTGELLAQETADVVAQGGIAQRNMGALDRLDQALSNSPQGGAGALASFAGNLGIKTEGIGELEVAEAIISQLVPQQRPPGSGTMSDADLALFKRSLPRIINTPGGNREIINYLKAIGEYDMKRGQIARALQLGQIDYETASQQYAALGNPLAGLSEGDTGSAGDQSLKGRVVETEIGGVKYRVERVD